MPMTLDPIQAPGRNQTADQRRAAYAWEKVDAATNYINEYCSLAKGAPALVMNSGLMQTLAYLRAKGKPHHLALLGHLCQWLGTTLGGKPLNDGERFPPGPAADFTNVMRALCEAPSAFNMRATEEALDLLRWIRQFADAKKSLLSTPEDA